MIEIHDIADDIKECFTNSIYGSYTDELIVEFIYDTDYYDAMEDVSVLKVDAFDISFKDNEEHDMFSADGNVVIHNVKRIVIDKVRQTVSFSGEDERILVMIKLEKKCIIFDKQEDKFFFMVIERIIKSE